MPDRISERNKRFDNAVFQAINQLAFVHAIPSDYHLHGTVTPDFSPGFTIDITFSEPVLSLDDA